MTPKIHENNWGLQSNLQKLGKNTCIRIIFIFNYAVTSLMSHLGKNVV